MARKRLLIVTHTFLPHVGGIERVVYEDGYADALAREMLKESGIKIERFNRKRRVEGGR